MDIQSLSVGAAQNRVQEEAAVRVQASALSNMREQGAELQKLLGSAEVISDPARGQNVNLLA